MAEAVPTCKPTLAEEKQRGPLKALKRPIPPFSHSVMDGPLSTSRWKLGPGLGEVPVAGFYRYNLTDWTVGRGEGRDSQSNLWKINGDAKINSVAECKKKCFTIHSETGLSRRCLLLSFFISSASHGGEKLLSATFQGLLELWWHTTTPDFLPEAPLCWNCLLSPTFQLP